MRGSEKVTGLNLIFNQLRSTLIKRFHYAKRFYSVIFSQVIYPFVIILILAVMLWKASSSGGGDGGQSARLELDPKIVYGNTMGFVNLSKTPFTRDFYKPMLSDHSVTVNETDDPTNVIIKEGETNFRQYLMTWLLGGLSKEEDSKLMLQAWYNGQPYHAMPISLNTIHNALLRYYGKNKGARMVVTNAPLPETSRQDSIGPADSTVVLIMSSTFFPLALCTMLATYVFVPVIERVTRAKLLQLLTGLRWFVYWLGMFLWDMFVHFVASVILLLPFAFFCADVIFTKPEAAGSILLLLLLAGWNFIPLCYVLSHGFSNSNTGSNVISTAAFLVSIIPAPIIAALFTNDAPIDLLIAVWCLRLLPSFTVSWGLAKTMSVSYSNMFCDMIPPETLQQSCSSGGYVHQSEILRCCPELCKERGNCFQKKNPLAFDNEMAGIDALVLFVTGLFYFALLALVESGLLGRLWRAVRIRLFPKKYGVATVHVLPAADQDHLEDSDVLNERERLDQQAGLDIFERESLVALRLSKSYGQLCAVDDLTFAVHGEECFGLLGVNGAGKTSTFKMLTGDIRPTKGNAYIEQYNICTSLKKFQSFLGYCPQFDPLLDRLTGREMLNLFAALRGITFEAAPNVVNELIKSVALEEHADKETRIYSGGNKRKLSLALAIIGSPAVILLDEPSSGVDPVSRRKIWKVLEKVRETSGSSVILCTHSMEECEHLSERLGIMVNGKFKCLGSIQHLKSKFGQGYMVTIKPKKEAEDNQEAVTSIIVHFQNVFYGSILRDKNQGILQLQVTDTSIPWSKLFKEMEKMKQDFGIEDYLISGTTLEQIFLTFAKSQRVSDQHV